MNFSYLTSIYPIVRAVSAALELTCADEQILKPANSWQKVLAGGYSNLIGELPKIPELTNFATVNIEAANNALLINRTKIGDVSMLATAGFYLQLTWAEIGKPYNIRHLPVSDACGAFSMPVQYLEPGDSMECYDPLVKIPSTSKDYCLQGLVGRGKLNNYLQMKKMMDCVDLAKEGQKSVSEICAVSFENVRSLEWLIGLGIGSDNLYVSAAVMSSGMQRTERGATFEITALLNFSRNFRETTLPKSQWTYEEKLREYVMRKGLSLPLAGCSINLSDYVYPRNGLTRKQLI